MNKKDNTTVTDTFQQGDVLLRRLPSMPDGERKVVSRGRCVLAHGEVGHSHVLEAEESDAELVQIGDRVLLTLAKPAPVRGARGGGVKYCACNWTHVQAR